MVTVRGSLLLPGRGARSGRRISRKPRGRLGTLPGWDKSSASSAFFLRVEADVGENRGILRAMPGLTITERELAILAVAVTEMQRDGHRPFTDKFPIQVATCLVCGVGGN